MNWSAWPECVMLIQLKIYHLYLFTKQTPLIHSTDLLRSKRIIPGHLEVMLHFLGQSDARATVGGDIHKWNPLWSCHFRSSLKTQWWRSKDSIFILIFIHKGSYGLCFFSSIFPCTTIKIKCSIHENGYSKEPWLHSTKNGKSFPPTNVAQGSIPARCACHYCWFSP